MNNPGGINEQARRQFESAWKIGEPPAIAELLPDKDDPFYRATLEKLVQIDIELRGSHQERAPAGEILLRPLPEYLQEFPELAEPAIILRLVQQEIHVRRACDLEVDLEGYVRDFSDIVGDIRDTDALLADSGGAFRPTVLNTPVVHEAQTFIPSSLDEMKSAMTVLPGIDPTSSLASVPERIGNYRLIRQIGAGGMGCVYEAEEIGSGQKVAVKVVLPELVASDEAIDRFRQEGQLASNISHPNCVFVLEADQEGAYPYIVMELVKGTDLEDHIKAHGPLELMDALRKTVDIAEGLEEAHRIGVIHRDVKPSNCFLTEDGRIKIGDFGLSRTLAEDAQLTRSGSFIGTPLYASPEQIRNDKLDGRTDVYSVASTLYFMLAGQAPFHGGDPVSTMARIVTDPASPIRDHRPDVHREIAKVIHRGLETDRKKRWASMTDFRNALVQFLPEHRTPVGESLRFVAYIVDILILIVIAVIYGYFLGYSGLLQMDPDTMELTWKSSIIIAVAGLLAHFLYFVPMETRFGCTPGKRIFGFRIRRTDGQPMNSWEILSRTMILWMFGSGITFGLTILSPNVENYRLIFALTSLLSGPVALLPLLTMRARNGYRGIHDLWSGSVVIRIPNRKTRKTRVVAVEDISMALPTITSPDFVIPTQLGAYRVEKPLRWKDNEMVLDAQDDRLDRNVWIHMRSPGSGTTSTARRELDRRTRLRWLASGDHDGRPWDAYMGPEGTPLSRYIESQGTIDWLTTREIIESLGAELEQATADDSLSDRLSPQHIWIRPDGGVMLLDFSLHRDESVITNSRQSADDNGLALIAATAIYCLEGNCPTETELEGRDSVETIVDRPMPHTGRKFLTRCLAENNRFESISQFRTELTNSKDPDRDLPRVTVGRRLVHVLVQALLLTLPIFAFASSYLSSIRKIPAADEYQITGDIVPQVLLLLMVPTIVLLWTCATCGGYVFYGARIMIVRTNGARASRIRVTWRAFLAWLPFLTIMILQRVIFPARIPVIAYNSIQVTLIALLIAYPILALVFPRRGLHDVIADTTLVPR